MPPNFIFRRESVQVHIAMDTLIYQSSISSSINITPYFKNNKTEIYIALLSKFNSLLTSAVHMVKMYHRDHINKLIAPIRIRSYRHNKLKALQCINDVLL